jgi:hypothetical protein
MGYAQTRLESQGEIMGKVGDADVLGIIGCFGTLGEKLGKVGLDESHHAKDSY